MAKLILGGVAAVLIALLAGFLWGAAGKSAVDEARQNAELRSELLEARSAALTARVDLYNTNFGDASRHLEEARSLVTRSLARDPDTKRLEAALPPLEEAQRLAAKLDLGANARAAEAVKVLDDVLQTPAKP